MPEDRGCRTSVVEVCAGVLSCHVGEPQVALRVERHARVVDTLDTSICILLNTSIPALNPSSGLELIN